MAGNPIETTWSTAAMVLVPSLEDITVLFLEESVRKDSKEDVSWGGHSEGEDSVGWGFVEEESVSVEEGRVDTDKFELEDISDEWFFYEPRLQF